MTGFDSGRLGYSSLTAMVNGKAIKSASTAIDVQNIKLTGSDYNDIKEIIDVENPRALIGKRFLYGFGILYDSGTGVIYWWTKRKSKTLQPKPISTAHRL